MERWQHPCRSVLQENITSLGDQTWEAIHREILLYAKRKGIEHGRKVRIDSTVVETDIHHPTDSTLLWDGIRVITRWLAEGKDLSPEPGYAFCDHTRGAKKRVMIILNAKKDAVRHTAYRELLGYAHRVAGYASDAASELFEFNGNTVPDMLAAKELAAKLRISPASLAMSLKRMHRAGLLEKTVNENDLRQNLIRLTDKGRELFDSSFWEMESSAEEMLAGFSDGEIAALDGYLDRIRKNLNGIEESGHAE